MASPDQLKNFARLQQGAQVDSSLSRVKPPTPLPEEVRKRFPSMAQWEQREQDRHQELLQALASIKTGGGGP